MGKIKNVEKRVINSTMTKKEREKAIKDRENSIEFNTMIMKEMGFDETNSHSLIDQDTGAKVKYESRNLITPGENLPNIRTCVEFDPYNNIKMMSQMFTYYLDKLHNQGEIPEYTTIYTVDGKNGKSRIEMKSDEGKMTSGEYIRDQCRYADLILRIGGETNPEEILKPFDVERERKEYAGTRYYTRGKRKEIV